MATVPIEDTAIWFSQVADKTLRERLEQLEESDTIVLLADTVVGHWTRMKKGKNAKPTAGLTPLGPMRGIWYDWYKTRKGERIEISEVRLALSREESILLAEWDSAEDAEAFDGLAQ